MPRVIGMDASRGMLALTGTRSGIGYSCGIAEALPFLDRSFDLLTVGCAIHWFDRQQFVDEACRVLRPGGWLALYNDSFCGCMRENPIFRDWMKQRYLVWYPSPPRQAERSGPELFESSGFRQQHFEEYHHLRRFSPEALVDYLTTQSNVITAVRDRGEALSGIRARLLEAVREFFPSREGEFQFRGWFQVFRQDV